MKRPPHTRGLLQLQLFQQARRSQYFARLRHLNAQGAIPAASKTPDTKATKK